MPAAYTLDLTAHIGRIKCTPSSNFDDLERAVADLLRDPDFEASFGLLLELGGDSVLLAPTQALAVVELFVDWREPGRGPIAVYVPAALGIVPGRLITMLGRHHGLDIEVFQDRRAAGRWLADRLDIGRDALSN